MLATLPTSPHAITMSDSPMTSPNQFQDSASVENKICPGCQNSVMNETGGVVIAFGQSFFHVECFKCAKCNNKVTADTNLLLLSDGQPVCSNCSYSCSVCHMPILDEAIMTGDDSYHAHCFKCRACHNRIDELMFAKTSHGIYCMSCHHQRVARSRRHAQKQKDRDKSVSGSSSSRTRERLAKEQLKENGTGSPPQSKTPSTAQTTSTATSATLTPPVTGNSLGQPYRSATLPDNAAYPSPPAPPSRRQSVQSFQDGRQGANPLAESTRSTSSRRPSVTVDPPRDTQRGAQPSSSRPSTPAVVDEFGQKIKSPDQHTLSPTTMLNSMTALLAPSDADDSMQRRPSYDGDIRPLDILYKKNAAANGDAVQGLTVPNKGLNNARKRHSINPGAPLDLASLSGSEGSTSQSMNGRGSPYNMSSPVREQPGNSLARKSSQSSLRAPPMLASKSESASQSRKLHSNDRPGSAGSTRSEYPQSQQEPVRPPLQQSVTLDRVPPRSHSLVANVPQETSRSLDRGPSPLGLPSSIRPARSFDDRSARPNLHGRALSNSLTIDVEKARRPLGTRSPQASPAHKIDVPSGIESGTDTEAEGDNGKRGDSSDDGGPVPPPKDGKAKQRPEQLELSEYMSPDMSDVPRTDSAAVSDAEESSPVQRVSRSTFIAPALPPIRFSMNTGDFSDLLQSVNGRNSMKGLDQLAAARPPPKTPPPTAASDEDAWKKSTPTPTSVTTFTMSSESMDHSDATSMTSMATVSASLDHSTSSKKYNSDERRSSTPSRSSFSPIERAPSQNSSLPDTMSRSNSIGSSNAHSDTRSAAEFPSSQDRDRSYSELAYQNRALPQRERFDSSASFNPDGSVSYESSARITVTTPGSSVARPLRYDASELVTRRLQEALHEASKRGAMHVNLDKEFVQAILMVVEQRKVENAEMKGKLDGMKRASQQYMDGLTVAQGEYDKELNARREAEAEVTRLRVLLSGQAARITAMSGESRKGELQKQLTQELSDNLSGLERDVSVLRVERDVALAEVEELVTSKSSPSIADSDKTGVSVSRSLTTRLDKLKSHYKRELVPLTEEREALLREIAELKGARDVFLEETTMLNARNEELAQLNALYARRMENGTAPARRSADGNSGDEKRSLSLDKPQPPQPAMQPSNTVLTTASLATDESTESKFVKVQKPDPNESPATLRGKFRWRAMREITGASNLAQENNEKGGLKHAFQQLNVLRFTRCDHCGDKLWGSLCRCSACNISVHPRCVNNVQSACTPQAPSRREDPNQQMALLPSMFGRDLVEQVRADAKGGDRMVPVLVEKCIQAVEASAMEYEGIYRKTGGSSQSKLITQLFEHGDYASFDLLDSERFNDICSITSVLKTYFRSLPNPLLTFALHDEFMHASAIRDAPYRDAKYADLVKQLPTEHYYTLRVLMLHLHRVHLLNATNLMTARNLGVVFGPTLMRSRDPSAEFSDMAGKALSVEWLVENAPEVFPPLPNSS
ncbi:RhoGAP-domain-containing protein [Dentipellis sp. KUC8613]|nr:RhoGAP-domain-containing protein [Dentipellis sp. KUC8613]